MKREEFSDKKPEKDPTFDSSKVEISSGKNGNKSGKKRTHEEIQEDKVESSSGNTSDKKIKHEEIDKEIVRRDKIKQKRELEEK